MVDTIKTLFRVMAGVSMVALLTIPSALIVCAGVVGSLFSASDEPMSP